MTDIIKGKLDPFFETGTEGVIWSVYEDGKEGYDGLHCLEDGDYLMVFNPDDDSLVWEGNVNLEYERNYRPYPMNPKYGQQEVYGFWVHGLQENVEPEDWGTWFFKSYPANLIKCGIGKLYRTKSSTVLGYRYTGHGSRWNNIKDKGDLIIKFKSGYYKYKDVPSDTFWDFYDAESLGKYFAQHIKNKFEFEKMEIAAKPEMKVGASLNKPQPWNFPTGNKP